MYTKIFSPSIIWYLKEKWVYDCSFINMGKLEISCRMKTIKRDTNNVISYKYGNWMQYYWKIGGNVLEIKRGVWEKIIFWRMSTFHDFLNPKKSFFQSCLLR